MYLVSDTYLCAPEVKLTSYSAHATGYDYLSTGLPFQPTDLSSHLKLSSCTRLRHLSLHHQAHKNSYSAVWRWMARVLELAPSTLSEVRINCAFGVHVIHSSFPEEDMGSNLDDALDRIHDLQSVVININVYHLDPYSSSTLLSTVQHNMPKMITRGVLRTELTVVPYQPRYDSQWLEDF